MERKKTEKGKRAEMETKVSIIIKQVRFIKDLIYYREKKRWVTSNYNST